VIKFAHGEQEIPEEWFGLPTIVGRLRRVYRMQKRVRWLGVMCQEAAERLDPHGWVAFVTLTYRPEVEWGPRHITQYIRSVRRVLERRGVRPIYLWVAELTAAGAVHYHCLFWLPRGVMLPKPDQAGWEHGWSRIEKMRSRGVGYLLKYARKGSVRLPFPRGLRLYGFGGLDGDQRDKANWHCLPRYQRERCEWFEAVRKCAGGWISAATGQRFGPWVVPYFMKWEGWSNVENRPRSWRDYAVRRVEERPAVRDAGADWIYPVRQGGPQIAFAY